MQIRQKISTMMQCFKLLNIEIDKVNLYTDDEEIHMFMGYEDILELISLQKLNRRYQQLFYMLHLDNGSLVRSKLVDEDEHCCIKLRIEDLDNLVGLLQCAMM